VTDENADQAWALMLDFVAEHGASLEAAALVEDFIDRHADEFAARIEEQARVDHSFAELVAQAYLGDMSGAGAERVRHLQDELFARGDVGLRWQGWIPLRPDQFPPEET
jgi:hypothetical protein